MTLNHHLLWYSFFSFGLIFGIALARIPAGAAQAGPAHIRMVQTFEAAESGLSTPSGLAFSPRANSFLVVQKVRGEQPPADIELITLGHFGQRAGSARIAAQVKDPINMAYDSHRGRLLILQYPANQLIAVQAHADGKLDAATLVRHDVRLFGLQDPQGMSVDPANGEIYILEKSGPRVLRVAPREDGSFEQAGISTLDLSAAGIGELRGLAFDSNSRHLHIASPADQMLYELDLDGQIVASRDLSTFNLAETQGMVFAPSGDQTDDPGQLSLYLADAGRADEPGLANPALPSAGTVSLSSEATTTSEGDGQILEFSLTPLVAPTAASFGSTLVRTVDLAAFSPPSPDPSGLAYIEASNNLMVSDGEVEETVNGITHFEGANVWELTLGGSVVDTANISKIAPTVVPMSNEPTGVAWNPANGHFFFSDDSARDVFEINPGNDGRIGTADDSWSSFDTAGVGSGDPEGIAYDSWHGRLFVADGVNMEVYEFTLAGDLVSQFDVQVFGVGDPEAIEFNPNSGTLLIMSSDDNTPVIIETTTSGELLQTIDISAANALTAAGLAYAPASDGSAALRFYIVDRGVDNNNDANIVDGKMIEMTAPAPSTPGNTPPVVEAGPDQTTTKSEGAALTGTISDDGLPSGTVTIVWSKASGPGTVTFSNPNALTTTASFSALGTYILNLTASDGELSGSDETTVTVTGAAGEVVLEARIAASSDDAEESSSGSIDLTSSDLELVYDRSNQTVGMRFNAITIPQGSAITNAYIQFQVDEANSGDTALTIQAENVDNALSFTSSTRDISSRLRTSASVGWNPPPWPTVGAAGTDQQTPDIATVVQEVISRPGWASGNSLAIIITGTGERTAESYNGNSDSAALLHVEYIPDGPGVTIASPPDGNTFTIGYPVTFTGTASDAKDGDLTSSLNWNSSIDGLIGTGGSFSSANLSAGNHIITASTVDSDGILGSDTISITIFPTANVVVGAGDIAGCGSEKDAETAALLDNQAGTVITLGDNVYDDGSEAEFAECYDPTWGRHKARTRPSLGNHDYHTLGASGYFNYFGAAAGDPSQSYYSYDVGAWHIIVLNSECSAVGGCEATSPQGQWLQADLAANPTTCTLAYWHHPRFTSGSSHTNNLAVSDFWSLLYEYGADVVLNGHSHNYERFAPQNPDGIADPDYGIRQFVVGTGGGHLHTFSTIQENSEVRNGDTFGVLRLTLNPDNYEWQFLPIEGMTFTDSGSAACVSPATGNTAPVAADDVYAVSEDSSISPAAPNGVLANDSDADGDALSAILVDDVANGLLTLNAGGAFTYTPNPNFDGTDTFTYKANDGTADSNIATATITVSPVDDPPVANDDSASTAENTAVTVNVAANDSDPDGDLDPTTASSTSGPASGALVNNGDGSLTYTPNPGFNGSDSFTYQICDLTGLCDSATASITVSPVNDPPTAVDDGYTTDEDTIFNVPAPGVLANDIDPEGDPLTAILVTGPANGSLSLNADGSFSYTPNPNYNGGDSFAYKANDGTSDSNTATATLTVNPVNDRPIARSGGPYYGTVGNPVQFDASASTDLDGTIMSYDWDFGDGNGGSGINPTHTYAATGTYTVVLTVTDDNNTTSSDATTANIEATPNQAPTAVDDAYSTTEDTPLSVTAPGVLTNDNDPDGDPLTAVLVSGVSNGNLTLNTDGSFTYTPIANFNGSDPFTYKASDGMADSNTVTVSITVNPANDPPTANDDAYATDEDVALTVAAPGVLGNDSDSDGDPLTAMLVLGPAKGTVTLNTDGSFTYTPKLNANGVDSFTYKARDGAVESNTATVTLTINAINDTPTVAITAPSDGATFSPGVTITFNGAANDVEDGDLSADLVWRSDVDGPIGTGASFATSLSNGAHTITASVTDGGSSSSTDQIIIMVAAPVTTLLPSHDATVYSNDPNGNYGAAQTLEARTHKKQAAHSYLKFDLSGLSASVTRATLRIYSSVGTNSTVSVYNVSNNYKSSATAWTEAGITWNIAPVFVGTSPLASTNAAGSGVWVEFDVTAALGSGSVYSFGLANDSPNWGAFNSKEAPEFQPQLVLELQTSP